MRSPKASSAIQVTNQGTAAHVGPAYDSNFHTHYHNTPQQALDRLDALPEAAFNASNKQHVPRCLPNTRENILARILAWVEGESEKRVYWLKGWAGTGKSTIALTVASELKNRGSLGASFFFARGGGDLASTRKFVAEIASQLTEWSTELREHIASAAATADRIQTRGLYEQWEALVLQPLEKLNHQESRRPLVIVIDALDECDDHDDIALLVRCLTAKVTVRHIRMMIFVTSRPDQPINIAFSGVSSDSHRDFILHDIEQSIVDQDLAIYYEHHFQKLQFDPQLCSDNDIQTLVQQAQGLFVYASTVCLFICKVSHLARERLNRVIAGPLPTKAATTLDAIYLTILNYSWNDDLDVEEMAKDQELLQHLMGSIAVLCDVQSLDSLAMLLGEESDKVQCRLDCFHALLDIPQKSDSPIRLLHPSFREFLLDSARCADKRFSIKAKEAHNLLFECCLRVMEDHLHQDICDFGQPGIAIDDMPLRKVNKSVPAAVQYACRYWATHLSQSDVDPQTHTGVTEFFENRFTFWLEALALIRRLDEGIAGLRSLEPKTSRGRYLGALVYDAKRFLLNHFSIIKEAPLQVYSSALLFSPTASPIRGLYYKSRRPTWILSSTTQLENWNECLQTLRHTNRVAQNFRDGITAVAVSSDGRFIVSGSVDETVRIWDLEKGGIERQILRGHSDVVSAVAISSDGCLIASSSYDQTVRIWDLEKGGTECQVLRGHLDRVNGVAFSPDGRFTVSGSYDRTVRIWDLEKGGRERQILRGHLDVVTAVAISPDGRLIASGSFDRTIRIWELQNGGTERQVLERHSKEVRGVAFSPDSRFIVSGSNDETIRIWDLQNEDQMEPKILDGHSHYVSSVLFSPDGQFIASSSDDATIRIWDLDTGECQQVLQGHFDGVETIAISSDGQFIVSGSKDQTVRIWDLKNESQREVEALGGHMASVTSVVFSPDGQFIATGSDETVCIWSPDAGECRQELFGHLDWISAVAISPDGHFIASGSCDKTIRIWESDTGECKRVLQGHSDSVTAVAISPNGRFIASGSGPWDKTIRIWESDTGECKRVLQGHSSGIRAMAISPDDRFIASGSYDKTIRIWESDTGECQQVLQGHSDDVTAVAISPDGRFIASGSRDKTSQIWEVNTGECRWKIYCAAIADQLSFGPEGKSLVTEHGEIAIPRSTASLPSTTSQPDTSNIYLPNFSISENDSWVEWNKKNLLRLPENENLSCSAISDSAIALGCESGRVIIIKFARDKLPTSLMSA